MRIEYCYDEAKKDTNKRAQAKFLRAAAKLLPDFKVDFKFNPGGIAVWGEHWVKITRLGQPVIEAIVEKNYTIVRQWDGRDSGHNHQLTEGKRRDPETFAKMVTALATGPFVRF